MTTAVALIPATVGFFPPPLEIKTLDIFTRSDAYGQDLGLFHTQVLSGEAIGQTTVTFSGVIVGTEIRVLLANGTELAGVESCTANQALTWNLYVPGHANNNVTIRFVSLGYEIFQLNYVTTLGFALIPVQQRVDRNYQNL